MLCIPAIQFNERNLSTYFDAGPNPKRQFESYFLTFPAGGARLEIMRVPGLEELRTGEGTYYVGYAHLAIAVGSRQRVVEITAALRRAGVRVIDGPRVTGDGYYESTVLDPDGNRVEITV